TCNVSVGAAGILANDLDFLASDLVAMLLHIKLDASLQLVGGVGERTGIGQDQPNLDGLLCKSTRCPGCAHPQRNRCYEFQNHSLLPVSQVPATDGSRTISHHDNMYT